MEAAQSLAQRIAGVRQRLRAMLPEAGDEHPAAVSPPPQLQEVTRQLTQLQENNLALESALAEHVSETASVAPSLPARLTWRTRRLLLRGAELLEQLKSLASDFVGADAAEDHAAALYQQTVSMAELTLRAVKSFPEAIGDQLRLCDGLEAALDAIAERWSGLNLLLARRRMETDRIAMLAHSLAALVQGRPLRTQPLQELAVAIDQEAQDAAPLRWLSAPTSQPECRAAAHALNVAQILARLVRSDAEWRGRAADAVLAAVVMDAGMAALPESLLGQTEPLNEDQRRLVEAHVGMSAEGIKRLLPAEGWLLDAVLAHHERCDGTGYPAGVSGAALPRLARLLAVCDVYVALGSSRSHRPAFAPRAALTETLLEAEKGRLDTASAELLLTLSFYPVGSGVELSDGQIGMVIATNPVGSDLASPARPVVALLIGADGQPLPCPHYVNLAQGQGRHIVRGLTSEETRELLGPRHWELL
jgi:HD-GYP domain-containing protein (c-di-GMP phosphodiesterase class II)